MVDPDKTKAGRGSEYTFKAFRVAGPLFGSGIQLAAAVVLFFFVGRWVDGALGTAPWFMLIGALAGAGGGLYTFIKTAINVGNRESEKKELDED